ncbi:NERD domain-containing protein [Halobacillus sp. Marseille-P3879]|uniref:NERD domain-containing protein n=1 Tax=Halobacillus sp. Marseille-P3879 TaxID=2045014 RepID=UPI000C7BBDCA|nr:NERD domain-containing protein [Halobacillus sp. Marseille-P3879]
MAQLIKLQDYISRYESNIYHYPAKYIRLKQQKWNQLKRQWENGEFNKSSGPSQIPERKTTGWKQFFTRKNTIEPNYENESVLENTENPKNINELKKYFLDELLPFQLKWASTTLLERSFIDPGFKEDLHLQMLLQRLPDHYLILYKPIVEVNKAPMEAGIIIIGPYEVEVINYIDVEADYISPYSQKQWHKETNEGKRTMSSPLLSLKRTETYLRSIMSTYDFGLEYRLTVLAPGTTIYASKEPYLTSYVDERSFERWLMEKRMLSTPLKHSQLMMAEKLLKHTRTAAVKRPEWEESSIEE